ncbi:MAG: hypothetical protein KJ063_10480 [Anaerolineae bacterium]|nr:hypothetical protein [Anaerolineae bacterium]
MNRKQPIFGWMMVIALLLMGCRAQAGDPSPDQPVTGLVVPTLTQAATTPLAEQGVTSAAATVSLTQPPANADLSSPTPLLATPFPPTPTLTHTPPSPPTTAPGDPVIHSFNGDLSNHPNGHDKIVTLRWQSSGGGTIRINDYANAGGRFVPGWYVEASGSMTLTLSGDFNRHLSYELVVFPQAEQGTAAQQMINIPWPCAYDYFFPVPVFWRQCAVDGPTFTAAAEQRFERGRMIWLQTPRHPLLDSQPTIIVIYEGEQYTLPAWQSYLDLWTPDQPIDDPTLIPPTGLIQPQRGFGAIWRLYPEVRERLGWALAPEVGYTTGQQSVPYDPTLNLFISTSDGRIIWLGRTSYDHTPHWQWLEL